MIRVDHLTKAFESRLALDDLSLTIEPGEILGLVGPNGAGKTTALRCIAGILPPTSGTVSIGNFDIVKQPIEAKKRLALIPDEPHLFGSLTVWEHLEFTAKVYNVPGHATLGERILAEFELLERRNDVADELSRGMRQKVAIACALLHDPQAILLDEPLTGLDPKAIRNLYTTLNQRAASETAILLSSHLLSQIEKLCTKFLILREGCRVAYGSTDDIRSQLPALEKDASLEEIFFKATE
jgi:ABC-2 type transport system ATP-binding protein